VRETYNLPAAAGGTQEDLRTLVGRWGH